MKANVFVRIFVRIDGEFVAVATTKDFPSAQSARKCFAGKTKRNISDVRAVELQQ